MNKLPVFLLSFSLLLAACAPSGSLATPALPENTSLPSQAPAITAAVSTAILPTSASSATAPVTAVVAATAEPAATTGGPVVITVVPANGTPPPGATAYLPGEVVTPIPTLPAGMSPTELKYHVLSAFPNLFYCDHDMYPVAHGDEATLAQSRFPEIQANQEVFQTILGHLHLPSAAALTADQKLLVYREYKLLAAIHFQLAGDKYQFQLQTKDASGRGQLITGLIDGTGAITNQQSQPAVATCPICLAAQTKIDTPRGPVAVADLHIGDVVWTVDAAGARVAAPVLLTTRVPVPATHQMAHLTLDDGRELWASPGHPTSDGRFLGNLVRGDWLDGARVVLAERVTYGQPATFDLLPASATGFYWADGILIGSTLKQ